MKLIRGKLFPDKYLLLISVEFVVLCRVGCLWVTGVFTLRIVKPLSLKSLPAFVKTYRIPNLISGPRLYYLICILRIKETLLADALLKDALPAGTQRWNVIVDSTLFNADSSLCAQWCYFTDILYIFPAQAIWENP